MILIADDDMAIRASLSLVLRRGGYQDVQAVATPEATVEAVRRSRPDLLIMDMNYSSSTGGQEGIELLRKVKVLAPDLPVILISAWGSIPLAVEGMRYGASDFITKPWNNALLLSRVATVLELSKGKPQEQSEPVFDRSGIIGHSPALESVLATVSRIAATDASVLILGENGTGKELIAEAIHRNSQRRNRPFVKVNLGGIPAGLFESEMFGHRKGAFTGAVADRAGRFECADGGTIFLDEIGELDLSAQVKMLRVLQEHTFEPLGSSRSRTVDVRVVSATNAPLQQMVADRTFREDLFYRLNLITVTLPPLRERREDIPLLVSHFAAEVCGSTRKSPVRFSPEALAALREYNYPGNIRELKNIVERTILMSQQDGLVSLSDLPVEVREPASSSGALGSLERKAVEDAISRHGGNLTQAAADLGITRQALYRRMAKYGIDR